MSSFFLSALCRPVSTAFHRLPPSAQLPKCWRTLELLSVSLPSTSSFIRLMSAPCAQKSWRSSSTSSVHIVESCSLRPSSASFSSCNQKICLRAKSIRGRSTFHGIFRPISFGAPHLAKKGELVTIHFINRDGEKMTIKARTGQNLLDIVVDNDLDIDGYGACEGTLSCSTCHLYFSEDLFKILLKPSDEELDMLDLAYGQTDMSRLGCQVILTKEMDGMTVVVPEGVADARDA